MFFLFFMHFYKKWNYKDMKIDVTENVNSARFTFPNNTEIQEINLEIFDEKNGEIKIQKINKNQTCDFAFSTFPDSNQFSGSCISNINNSLTFLYKPKNIFSLTIISNEKTSFISITAPSPLIEGVAANQLCLILFAIFCLVGTCLVVRWIAVSVHILPNS